MMPSGLGKDVDRRVGRTEEDLHRVRLELMMEEGADVGDGASVLVALVQRR